MKKKIMIVPIARIAEKQPIETKQNEAGWFYCLHALNGINTDKFDEVYFVISKNGIEKYGIDEKLLRFQIEDAGFNLVVLQNDTVSQAETIISALIQLKIFGYASLFCKDGDGSYDIDIDDPYLTGNSLMVCDIENCDTISPKHKSYVSVDMNNLVTNTVENTVISKYINCGGYRFNDVQDFIRAYEELVVKYNKQPKMSNIVQYLMLYKSKTFTATICSNYKDFTLKN